VTSNNDERSMPYHLSTFAPPVRMMVLVAWIETDEQGDQLHANDYFEVLGLASYFCGGGLHTTPIILINNAVTNLTDALRVGLIQEGAEVHTVACDWERHQDVEYLKEQQDDMAELAKKRYEEREAVHVGQT
jgi:hypothetical protein